MSPRVALNAIFLVPEKTQQSSDGKQFYQISSVSYLAALCAELILNVMVTECRSLLDTGYCDGCLFFSCSNTGEKSQKKDGKYKI